MKQGNRDLAARFAANGSKLREQLRGDNLYSSLMETVALYGEMEQQYRRQLSGTIFSREHCERGINYSRKKHNQYRDLAADLKKLQTQLSELKGC